MTERHARHRVIRFAAIFLTLGSTMGIASWAQASKAPADVGSAAQESKGASIPSGMGEKNTGSSQDKNKGTADTKSGQDSSSSSKPASAGEESASAVRLKLGPLAPSVPPTDLPKGRPVIGVALGGGGALAMTEIGVLQWMEEHHIPVDVIAGTSMGSILSALYSTGHTTEQMKHIMTEDSVNSVFRIQSVYTARSFRRREDSRDLPNSVTIGLKHGVSFRNSILTDTGLNELLDKEFLRYNDQTDFNDLPIPFRCQATDLNAAKTVTFARGSLQDAVRASASIPGVFRPFELDGHEFVDGAILQNLPTADVKAMKADVVIAISLPLGPVGKGDLDSIVGVLQRAFAVGIENNEARDRKLAQVVVMPNIDKFGANDYLKTRELSDRGYAAAEANKAALLPYAVTDAQWKAYVAHKASKQRGPVGTVLRVKVNAPNEAVKNVANILFKPLLNQPVDTDKVETLLSEIRADGRYDADYTVGYDTTDGSPNSDAARRPILLVTVSDKKTGPPFLDIGANVAAQTGGITRATINTILVDQDFGAYGSELRTNIDVGFDTRVKIEYFRRLTWSGFFAAPRGEITRQPFYIYQDQTRLSERQRQLGGGGLDVGWTDSRTKELRVGYSFDNVRWETTTGRDFTPDYYGNAQHARVRYIYDSQDRALVPRYGIRSTTDLAYLFGTAGSPSAPQMLEQIQFAHTLGVKNTVLLNAEGATMFNRAVAQPFRYTLGGPVRLSASAIDQYRGTDYFLITPGYLRRLATLPAPLGQSLYAGISYEVGQIRAPNTPNINRQDVLFGIVAETPLGVITIAPSFGNAGERKLSLTIGKFF